MTASQQTNSRLLTQTAITGITCGILYIVVPASTTFSITPLSRLVNPLFGVYVDFRITISYHFRNFRLVSPVSSSSRVCSLNPTFGQFHQA